MLPWRRRHVPDGLGPPRPRPADRPAGGGDLAADRGGVAGIHDGEQAVGRAWPQVRPRHSFACFVCIVRAGRRVYKPTVCAVGVHGCACGCANICVRAKCVRCGLDACHNLVRTVVYGCARKCPILSISCTLHARISCLSQLTRANPANTLCYILHRQWDVATIPQAPPSKKRHGFLALCDQRSAVPQGPGELALFFSPLSTLWIPTKSSSGTLSALLWGALGCAGRKYPACLGEHPTPFCTSCAWEMAGYRVSYFTLGSFETVSEFVHISFPAPAPARISVLISASTREARTRQYVDAL